MALWEQWRIQARSKQDKAQREFEQGLSSEKRPMTDRECSAINLLQGCRFLPASFEKRFVRSLNYAIDKNQISDKQSYWLKKIFYRYRRQLGLTDEAAKAYFD